MVFTCLIGGSGVLPRNDGGAVAMDLYSCKSKYVGVKYGHP